MRRSSPTPLPPSSRKRSSIHRAIILVAKTVEVILYTPESRGYLAAALASRCLSQRPVTSVQR